MPAVIMDEYNLSTKSADLGRRAGSDLPDRWEPVLLVARIDALGAVAREEVLVELQARLALENGDADFLGAAGVNRGFIHHDVALLEHLADALARLHQRREIRPFVLIDRRRHRDDVNLAALHGRQIHRELQVRWRP